MNFLFFDTETSGVDKQSEIIQLAYKGVDIEDRDFQASILFSTRESKLMPETMAVHHITPEMIQGKEYATDFLALPTIQSLFRSLIPVAHNAKFDIGMLARHGLEVKEWICTYKIAYHFFPALPHHNLQHLRYALGLYKEEKERITAHDAMGDVLVLENLLRFIWNKFLDRYETEDAFVRDMLDITQRPILLRECMFGKHRGKTFEEISKTDVGYLQWIQKTPDLMQDENLAFTINHYLR